MRQHHKVLAQAIKELQLCQTYLDNMLEIFLGAIDVWLCGFLEKSNIEASLEDATENHAVLDTIRLKVDMNPYFPI